MSKATAAAKNLPPQSEVPEGMKRLGNAPTWKPENPGDAIHGTVTEGITIVTFEQKEKIKGKMTTVMKDRRKIEVTTLDSGDRYTVWESAALGELFDKVEENGPGDDIFIRFDGYGEAKPGQNAPKLFTVAMAE